MHFLERVFHKLLLNFTWWVNRKDSEGNNLFEGGFLGLDNIGPFDRSTLPVSGHLEQSDGTAWMAMYCQNLLELALLLAGHDDTYEDLATKFYEHFALIASALNEKGLWNEEDGFYYDVLHLGDGKVLPLRARSMVGLLPLAAVTTLGPATMARLPDFMSRVEWFTANRREGREVVQHMESDEHAGWRMLSIVDENRLRRILGAMLDPDEFLSDHGIRALSRRHAESPLEVSLDGTTSRLDYEPAESTTGLFGGNSNWRGPVWFPVNYLLVEVLRVYHRYLGDAFRVECPTGSGQTMSLAQVADELAGAARRHLPRARGRDAARLRRLRALPARPGLARPDPVPRVLPRRHGRRPRRLAPDRLDRARRRSDHPPWARVGGCREHGSQRAAALPGLQVDDDGAGAPSLPLTTAEWTTQAIAAPIGVAMKYTQMPVHTFPTRSGPNVLAGLSEQPLNGIAAK